MRSSRFVSFILAAGLVVLGPLATPASAGRTAIDEYSDGSPWTRTFSGYCDLDLSDCNPQQLGYSVSLGGGAFSSNVLVYGNGLVGFGDVPDLTSVFADIQSFGSPSPTDYGQNLVSAGQTNDLYFDSSAGEVFLQTGVLDLLPNGVIHASFYKCTSPLSCPINAYALTLTPTFSGPGGQSGYNGQFTFGSGTGTGSDIGYVVDGQFTPVTGTSFFLPAQFRDLVLSTGAVPEPASWMLLIGGFAGLGSALRTRRRSPARTLPSR